LDTAIAGTFRRDAKVIGLIAGAHCLSHFLQLALPPLFVFLKVEFDVSYASLGALMSVFYAGSGLCQFAAGFAVDRFGARPVLLGGVALIAGGTLLGAVAPGFAWLYLVAALMGVGNGVFHPADFAILNGRVASRRLGHAYSLHGVGGSLGYALAPLCSYALASAFGWRVALATMGLAGLVVLAILVVNARAIETVGHRGKVAHDNVRSIDIFRQTPILLCFAFFGLYTLAIFSVQTLGAPALNAAYAIPMAAATSAITGYLLGSTAGIVAGGFLAGRTQRHDRVAAGGLATGAVMMLIVAAVPMVSATVLPLFALAGFALGCTGPSRDMIVRKATPPGGSGRTYGFVYSGLDLGATIGPVLAGSLLDHHAPRLVFVTIAAFLLLSMATVVEARRHRPSPIAAPAAD
jgi:MFS family permease